MTDQMLKKLEAETRVNCSPAQTKVVLKRINAIGSMVNHTMYGQCLFQPERESLLNIVKVMYIKKLSGDSNIQMATTEMANVLQLSLPLDILLGVEINQNVEAFQRETFFLRGKIHNRCLIPWPWFDKWGLLEAVMDSDSSLLKNSSLPNRFKASFTAEQNPRETDEDFAAAEFEDAMAILGNEVLRQTQPSHSFSYVGYNLCDLVATKRLSKRTVTMHATNSLNARRKAP